MNKPNKSWIETHHEIVELISYQRSLVGTDKANPMITEINDTQGTGGFWELCEELTDKFEALNAGRQWDGEYYDELEKFVFDSISPKPKKKFIVYATYENEYQITVEAGSHSEAQDMASQIEIGKWEDCGGEALNVWACDEITEEQNKKLNRKKA